MCTNNWALFVEDLNGGPLKFIGTFYNKKAIEDYLAWECQKIHSYKIINLNKTVSSNSASQLSFSFCEENWGLKV